MNIQSPAQAARFGSQRMPLSASPAPAARGPQKTEPSPVTTSAQDPSRSRLEAVETTYIERLDQLLNSGTLSTEEAHSLQAAGADFQALVERLDHALMNGGLEQDGKLGRAFHHALGVLKNDVHKALSGGVAESSSGGPGAVGEAAVEATGSSASDQAGATAERIAGAFDRIDSRLANLAEARGREGGGAILALQDKFGDVFARLESAAAGGMNPAVLGELFERILGGLRDGISPDTDSNQALLYDAKSQVMALKNEGPSKGSFDKIG